MKNCFPAAGSEGDGVADCLEPPAIPAVTGWGATVLALLLLTAAKLRRDRLAGSYLSPAR